MYDLCRIYQNICWMQPVTHPDVSTAVSKMWHNNAQCGIRMQSSQQHPCHRPENVHGCLKSTFHQTGLENSAWSVHKSPLHVSCLLEEVLTWAPVVMERSRYNVQHESMLHFFSQGIHLHIRRRKKNLHLQKSNLMVKACIEGLLPEIWQPSICCQSFLWHIAHQPAKPKTSTKETSGIRRISEYPKAQIDAKWPFNQIFCRTH